MIKAAVLCLGLAHLVSVSAGIFVRNDQTERNSPATKRVHAAQSAGYLSEGRQRPLFARRGQHEQQKPRVLKHSAASGIPRDLSPASKVASRPAKRKCSQLTQSCWPKSRCCDPWTTCRCRFFKTICFCQGTEKRKRQRQT